MNQNILVEQPENVSDIQEEYPLTVREAAKYLGVRNV
jgi:hypothetical protein